MPVGIINVNKPKGLTSQNVVSRIRKVLGEKQAGHTGTLDPLATGVLPVCLGWTTRIIEYLETTKGYRAYILLGVRTDTYDMEGKILQQEAVKLDLAQVKEALRAFEGEIEQTPPIYSAVHYKGKRLYEYARKNVAIADIPARKVTINDIRFVGVEREESENPLLIVDIDCSGGTYIRSIAHDLGEKLGCGACLENLTRTRAGKFRIEESYTLEQIEEYKQQGRLDEILIKPQSVLDFEAIKINAEQIERIKKGQYILIDKQYETKTTAQVVFNETLVAIAEAEKGIAKPIKVFCVE
jgi:tRNA pseudouridine55 synthase